MTRPLLSASHQAARRQSFPKPARSQRWQRTRRRSVRTTQPSLRTPLCVAGSQARAPTPGAPDLLPATPRPGRSTCESIFVVASRVVRAASRWPPLALFPCPLFTLWVTLDGLAVRDNDHTRFVLAACSGCGGGGGKCWPPSRQAPTHSVIVRAHGWERSHARQSQTAGLGPRSPRRVPAGTERRRRLLALALAVCLIEARLILSWSF